MVKSLFEGGRRGSVVLVEAAEGEVTPLGWRREELEDFQADQPDGSLAAKR